MKTLVAAGFALFVIPGLSPTTLADDFAVQGRIVGEPIGPAGLFWPGLNEGDRVALIITIPSDAVDQNPSNAFGVYSGNWGITGRIIDAGTGAVIEDQVFTFSQLVEVSDGPPGIDVWNYQVNPFGIPGSGVDSLNITFQDNDGNTLSDDGILGIQSFIDAGIQPSSMTIGLAVTNGFFDPYITATMAVEVHWVSRIDDPAGPDCNNDGIPDANDPDCNDNGLLDGCEIVDGLTPDCNGDGVPDSCDIASGWSTDCNGDGIPDECQVDCNGNGILDSCDIAGKTSLDCDNNGVPDECEDCNANGIGDACDIANGTAFDCNGNGVPDTCEADCNDNGRDDACDLADGTSVDDNGNSIPDECETTGFIDGGFDQGMIDLWTLTAPLALVFAKELDVFDVIGGGNGSRAMRLPPTMGHVSSKPNEAYLFIEQPLAIGTYHVEFDVAIVGEYQTQAAADLGLARAESNDPFQGFNLVSLGTIQADAGDITRLHLAGVVPVTNEQLDWFVMSVVVSAGYPTLYFDNFRVFVDCNMNGIPDNTEELEDCNENGVPDECESLIDCDQNGVPDVCENVPDFNGNGISDICECLGDIVTDDGLVTVADLAALLGGWGACDDCEACVDLNDDCEVDVNDLLALLVLWGPCG